MLNKVATAAVIKHHLSDFFPIVLHLKASIHRYEEKHPEMQKITPEKIEIFLQSLAERLKKQELQKTGILINFKTMTALTEKYFPKVKQSRRQFKFGVLKSIKRQQYLFRKYVSTKSTSDHVLYK